MTAVRPLQVLPSTRMLPACSLRAASAACRAHPVRFPLRAAAPVQNLIHRRCIRRLRNKKVVPATVRLSAPCRF